MAASSFDLGVASGLPPKEAISYFESKGYEISWNWYETLEAAHARAFTVAKCTRLDVLTSIRGAVDDALKQGLTEEQFIKQLTPTLQKLGWWGKQVIIDESGQAQNITLGTPYRLKTIYQTNTRTAYAAGRYAQMMSDADLYPYWQYVAVLDSHTRLAHAELNNMIFRYDDLFWQTHYPPNDWNCRCRVRAVSERRYQALGIPVTDSTGMLSTRTVTAGTDPLTGAVYETTVTTFNNGKVKMTPGTGWSYNVGSAAFGTDTAAARKLVETHDPDLRRSFIGSLNNSPARQLDFGVFTGNAARGLTVPFAVQTVGFISEEIAGKVHDLLGGNFAVPRITSMTSDHVDALVNPGRSTPSALSLDDVAGLPRLMANPQAVVLDNTSGELVYVSGQDNAAGGRTVARAPVLEDAAQNKLGMNLTASSQPLADLQAGVADGRYLLLQGAL